MVACYIGSDGVEDSYYDNEETQLGTYRFYMDLSCKLDDLSEDAFVQYLDRFLPEFSRTGSTDDVSVAGIVEREAISTLIDEYKDSIEQYDSRQSLLQHYEETNAKLISMTRKHGVLKQRVSDAELELKNMTDMKLKIDEELQHIISKRDRLSKRAEVAKTELEDYRREVQEVKSSVEERYHVISSAIHRLVNEITTGYSKKEAVYSHMLEKILEYDEKVREIEDELSRQDNAIEDQNQRLIKAREEFEAYDKVYTDLSEELKKIQAKIDDLATKE